MCLLDWEPAVIASLWDEVARCCTVSIAHELEASFRALTLSMETLNEHGRMSII